MEGKRGGASSSSIVEDLFGPHKDKSCEIFGFSTPSPNAGRRASIQSDLNGASKEEESQDKVGNNESAMSDGKSQGSQPRGQNIPNEDRNSYYRGETLAPCHLSSSLYYGGQDICSDYSSTQASGTQYTNYEYKKDGEDDQNNSNLASRGNWWQGSLYY